MKVPACTCGVRNHNQITVDNRSVQFFESSAQLLEITEYEPTRVAGRFTYKKANGVIPYPIVQRLMRSRIAEC